MTRSARTLPGGRKFRPRRRRLSWRRCRTLGVYPVGGIALLTGLVGPSDALDSEPVERFQPLPAFSSAPAMRAKTRSEARAREFVRIDHRSSREDQPVGDGDAIRLAQTTGTANTEASPERGRGGALIVAGDGVNVRFDPDLDAGIRMQLYRGHPVTALERRDEWIHVAIGGTGGMEGWIHASLLEPADDQHQRVAVPSRPEPAPEAADAEPASQPADAEPASQPVDAEPADAEPAAEQAARTPASPRPATPASPPRQAQTENQRPSPSPRQQPSEAPSAQRDQSQSGASTQVAQRQPAPDRQAVGEAPSEEEREQPAISGLREVGGVLTPKGVLVLEPVLRLSHSEVDRFTFRGIELIDTVLVGVIEAEESDRNLIEGSLTTRLGLTNRLEIEARIPGLYRDDDVSTTVTDAEGDAATRESSLDASGIGDVEAALHYQINRGGPGMPVFVGNLRGKFPTGEGPFDVDRDAFGVEEELPTGSGFYGIEPSVTVIYRSDPVVFFANGGYLLNLKRDVDERIGAGENAFRVGEVDPGDAIRAGFGMGFAVNERTSFSLGYSHDFIRETTTEIDGVDTESDDLQVGTLSVGFFHAFTDSFSLDLTTEIGATDEATDVSVVFRVPFSFQVF